jgi:hypothetical protein
VGDLLTDTVYLAVTSEGPDKGTAFLVDEVRGNLQKRPITARGYQACGFKRPARTVAQSVLSSMPTGDLIDWPNPYLNGQRFEYAPERTVYFIDRGLRRPLTGPANDHLFANSAWLQDNIDLGGIRAGTLLGDSSYLAKSADGPDRATVFLMEQSGSGWQKRPITARGFSTCGFSGPSVKAVPQATLDLIDFLTPPPTPSPSSDTSNNEGFDTDCIGVVELCRNFHYESGNKVYDGGWYPCGGCLGLRF